MNERIKELEKQSYVDVDHGDGVYQQFSREKFAELIIKECIDIVAHLRTKDDNEYNCSYNDAVDDAVSMMASAFGEKS